MRTITNNCLPPPSPSLRNTRRTEWACVLYSLASAISLCSCLTRSASSARLISYSDFSPTDDASDAFGGTNPVRSRMVFAVSSRIFGEASSSFIRPLRTVIAAGAAMASLSTINRRKWVCMAGVIATDALTVSE